LVGDLQNFDDVVGFLAMLGQQLVMEGNKWNYSFVISTFELLEKWLFSRNNPRGISII
jgi:hypothetical protein